MIGKNQRKRSAKRTSPEKIAKILRAIENGTHHRLRYLGPAYAEVFAYPSRYRNKKSTDK